MGCTIRRVGGGHVGRRSQGHETAAKSGAYGDMGSKSGMREELGANSGAQEDMEAKSGAQEEMGEPGGGAQVGAK